MNHDDLDVPAVPWGENDFFFFLHFQGLAHKSRVDKIPYQHQQCWIDFGCLVLLVIFGWVILVALIVCDGGPRFAVVGCFGGFNYL